MIDQFLNTLTAREIGDASSKKLVEVFNKYPADLPFQLAAAMDMEILCKSTYDMEGDGLEILLIFDVIEKIRAKGRTLGDDAADLPNLAAIMRKKKAIEKVAKLASSAVIGFEPVRGSPADAQCESSTGTPRSG